MVATYHSLLSDFSKHGLDNRRAQNASASNKQGTSAMGIANSSSEEWCYRVTREGTGRYRMLQLLWLLPAGHGTCYSTARGRYACRSCHRSLQPLRAHTDTLPRSRLSLSLYRTPHTWQIASPSASFHLQPIFLGALQNLSPRSHSPKNLLSF